MRYDAVFLYANKNHLEIFQYHLPPNPPGDPTQEQYVRVYRCCYHPRIIPHCLPPLIPSSSHALLWHEPNAQINDESDSENDNSNDKYFDMYTDPNNWVLVTGENIDSIELPMIETFYTNL